VLNQMPRQEGVSIA